MGRGAHANTRRCSSSFPAQNLERAELRILECGVALGASPSEMIALKVTDPDVDAERSYTLADYYRSHQQEPEMVAAVENAAARGAAKPLGRVGAISGRQFLLGEA